MKKLKKNQLKFDKEVITSLSENDLSIMRGGIKVKTSEAPMICIPTTEYTKGAPCDTNQERCLVTHNDKCIAYSKDNGTCVGPMISGGKNSCVCMVPTTQFNC